MALYSRAPLPWTSRPWRCHAERGTDGESAPGSSDSSRTSLENLERVISASSSIRSKLVEAYKGENKGGEFTVPLVITRTRKPRISVQRNIRRQEYLDKVAERDDSKTFAVIGLFVLVPPLIVLGGAIAAGYVQLDVLNLK